MNAEMIISQYLITFFIPIGIIILSEHRQRQRQRQRQRERERRGDS